MTEIAVCTHYGDNRPVLIVRPASEGNAWVLWVHHDGDYNGLMHRVPSTSLIERREVVLNAAGVVTNL